MVSMSLKSAGSREKTLTEGGGQGQERGKFSVGVENDIFAEYAVVETVRTSVLMRLSDAACAERF